MNPITQTTRKHAERAVVNVALLTNKTPHAPIGRELLIGLATHLFEDHYADLDPDVYADQEVRRAIARLTQAHVLVSYANGSFGLAEDWTAAWEARHGHRPKPDPIQPGDTVIHNPTRVALLPTLQKAVRQGRVLEVTETLALVQWGPARLWESRWWISVPTNAQFLRRS